MYLRAPLILCDYVWYCTLKQAYLVDHTRVDIWKYDGILGFYRGLTIR